MDSEEEVRTVLGETRPDLLLQIINYSNHEGPGPKAESGRLLAAIIKKGQNQKAMKNIIEMGGLPAITVMLHSSHPIMVNESLMSLTILTTTFANSSGMQSLNRKKIWIGFLVSSIVLYFYTITRPFSSLELEA